MPQIYARPFAKPPSLATARPQQAKPASASTTKPAASPSWGPAPAPAHAPKDAFVAAKPASTSRPVLAPAVPQPAAPAQAMKQTHRVEGTRIFAETSTYLQASPTRVAEALRGDWSQWWQHSSVKDLERTPDGGTQFGFKPLTVGGRGPTELTVKIGPGKTEKLANGNLKTTLPVELVGDFQGKARLELEQTGEGTTLRSIWDGVEPTGWKRHFPDLVAGMHMRVEAGAVPGFSNTGFTGLSEHLAKAAPVSAEEKLRRATTPGAVGFQIGQAESSARRAAKDGDGIRSFNQVGSDGRVNSRTEVPLHASPERVKEAILGNWDKWWKHSKVIDRSPDGRSFTIKPLGFGPTVGIKLAEPKETVENGLKRVRIDAGFSGDFTGNGYIEIQQLRDGRSQLSFNWPDFQVTGALKAAPGVAIGVHTRTLEGDIPGRDGTGLEGLVEYLKGNR